MKEADGTIRVVKYTADPHNGFNAVVERKGHAYHPTHHVAHVAHVAPVVHAAPIVHAPVYHHAPVVAHLGHGHAYSYAAGGLHYGHHY